MVDKRLVAKGMERFHWQHLSRIVWRFEDNTLNTAAAINMETEGWLIGWIYWIRRHDYAAIILPTSKGWIL